MGQDSWGSFSFSRWDEVSADHRPAIVSYRKHKGEALQEALGGDKPCWRQYLKTSGTSCSLVFGPYLANPQSCNWDTSKPLFSKAKVIPEKVIPSSTLRWCLLTSLYFHIWSYTKASEVDALFLSSYHGHPSHVESAPYFSFLTWPSFPSQQSQTPRLLSFLNSVVALLPSKYGVTVACNRRSVTLGFALCYLGTCPCGPAWSCVWACLVVRAIT